MVSLIGAMTLGTEMTNAMLGVVTISNMLLGAMGSIVSNINISGVV